MLARITLKLLVKSITINTDFWMIIMGVWVARNQTSSGVWLAWQGGYLTVTIEKQEVKVFPRTSSRLKKWPWYRDVRRYIAQMLRWLPEASC